MRFDRGPGGYLGIAAAAAWLPDGRSTATDGVAAGALDDDEARLLGYASLAVSPDRCGPELAVEAAKQATARAAWQGGDIDLVVHAWTYHQGHDFWSPAHFVAHAVGAYGALSVGVQQMCNGGVAALELAATRMMADRGVTRCLVTTGDRFAEPGFDRWGSDVDVAYGDSGTAVLLQRDEAAYRLLSIASVSRPRYELMHRGADEFSVAPGWHSDVVDVRRTKDAFTAGEGVAQFKADQADAVRRVLLGAVGDAGMAAGDPRIRCVVLPRIGADVLEKVYLPAMADTGLGSAEALPLGRDTGHLGAGDASAGVAHVLSDGCLGAGEVALVLNVGGGFTWSCMAVGRQ
jgi:3-oxoacyl-[acyl-carrier-protein] synthase III